MVRVTLDQKATLRADRISEIKHDKDKLSAYLKTLKKDRLLFNKTLGKFDQSERASFIKLTKPG